MLDGVGIAWRVFGGEHPLVADIENDFEESQAALSARETPSGSA